MRYHEIGASIGKRARRLSGRGATGNAESGSARLAQKGDLALDPQIEVGEEGSELAIEDGDARQVDDTADAGTAQCRMEIRHQAKGVDTKDAGIERGRNSPHTTRRSEETRIGVVPNAAAEGQLATS
jgi:hypothetical protein